MKLRLLSVVAFCTAFATAAPVLQTCGDIQFDPTKFTCYVGSKPGLCPIIYGVPTKPCDAACYSPEQYSCDGNTLTQLKPSQGRFSLAALHPGSPIDGRPIQAQDNHFWIGQGPKWYCASALMCPTPNVTVLADTESLSIIAPGGQKVYIQANGALAFWGGFVYSTNLTVTGLGGPAYAGGSAFGPNGITWKACPVREGVWQVFSNLPSVTFAQDCIDFYAHVVPFLSGADVASAYV